MARHLEETDIPIEYKGMKYNVSPSALRSNNLTVELPEVKVLGKRKNKGYKSAFDPNGAGEFAATIMNSPLQLADYAVNRFIDAGKGEHGKTNYRYTPVQTTMQRVGETFSPTRWAGTLKTGFKESPWSENNPGLTGNPYLDMISDALVIPSVIKKGKTNIKNTIASYNLYNNIKNGTINEINIPSKILYRANVYRGGKIKHPKYSFFTTDEKYASQYGRVNPYIFESKNIAVTKEPLIGSADPVNRDIMIYHNLKDNPSANAIVGYDKITGEFPYQSRGAEILNLNPNNIFPIKVNNFKTIKFKLK